MQDLSTSTAIPPHSTSPPSVSPTIVATSAQAAKPPSPAPAVSAGNTSESSHGVDLMGRSINSPANSLNSQGSDPVIGTGIVAGIAISVAVAFVAVVGLVCLLAHRRMSKEHSTAGTAGTARMDFQVRQ